MIKIKRVYEKPAASDGYRVLVDRVWPRGITKRSAAIQEWDTVLSPTTTLRRYFGHDPKRWMVFQRRYRRELRSSSKAIQKLEMLKRLGRRRTVTLVYGAHDEKHNQAVVLRRLFENRLV